MGKINITKFKILGERWKDPTYVGDVNRLNKLADDTIDLVNSEPILKNICEMFMYAVSVKAMTDTNFSSEFSSGGNIKRQDSTNR